MRRHNSRRISWMLNGSEPSAVFFGLRSQASKYRVRQQRQSDVAVPALPATHLILVEAAFTLGCLKADFDLPSPASDVDQSPTGPCCGARRRRNTHARDSRQD